MRWFLGVLLLLLVALLLESGLLAYAMYVLLALLILSRLLALSWLDRLWAHRLTSASEVKTGDSVLVQVTVHNKGALPVPWVLLEDALPARNLVNFQNRIRVKRRRIKLAMIPPGGMAELDYQVEFKTRGYFQVGPLVLETGDFFGLHRRYRVGAAPQFVLVYPKVIPLQGYDLASRRPIGEIRMAHRLYEDPTRVAGVREYQTGDSLGRVHWKVTARTGTLHCKIYEPSATAGATILLDFHAAGYPEGREPQRSETAVTAAASIAHALYTMGQQVGLITNGRDAAERIRREGWEHDFRSRKAALASIEKVEADERLAPLVIETRPGAEQFEHIYRTLARLELSDGLTFPQMLIETASRLPRDATVIALLPRVTSRTALALGNLRRRGFAVVAVLVMLEGEQAEQAQLRLLAERLEVRVLEDERGIAEICQRQVMVSPR